MDGWMGWLTVITITTSAKSTWITNSFNIYYQSTFYLFVFWTPTLCLVGGDEDVGGDEECSVLSGRNHIVSFVPHTVEPVEKFRSKYT